MISIVLKFVFLEKYWVQIRVKIGGYLLKIELENSMY